MRISAPSRTRAIIEKHGFSFKKSFGQNFLVDSNILEGIVRSAEITRDDFVIEIGPGIGSLTEILAENAYGVAALEIDERLIPILNETLADKKNVTVINQDVLKTDLTEIIDRYSEGKNVKVVANLPYYITTPIIMSLLEKRVNIKSITVMVQKEVAQRLQASPGGKDYGAITVSAAYYATAKTVMTVPPSCFMPPPKVESAVLRLDILDKPSVDAPDEKLFFNIVSAAFSQRRKTLLNCLSANANLNMDKEGVRRLIVESGFAENIRGEALSCEDFARLCRNAHKAQGAAL